MNSEKASAVSMPALPKHGGCLILNADDWGRDIETTDRTEECFRHGSISSVSAMVFMADSERAAIIARERGIDSGLHLNFTTAFTQRGVSLQLADHLERVSRHLRRHRYSSAMFHPWLIGSFEYIANAQQEEFVRLYGSQPARVDGHHHMHLCANVLLQRLLPVGVTVRRNFSFQPGQKGVLNRSYRAMVDSLVARVHPMTDYFYSLPPLEPLRLRSILTLAQAAVVEVETHPINVDEYQLLMNGGMKHLCGGDVSVAPSYVARAGRSSPS